MHRRRPDHGGWSPEFQRAMWRHHHLHHRLGPLGRYVRQRLHRRLFLWFGLTIIVTAIAMSASFALINRVSENSWHRDWDRGRDFLGRQLGVDWEHPTRNALLLKDIADTFEVNVELRDAQGRVLQQQGGACERPGLIAPVDRGGQRLGTLGICFDRRGTGPGWRAFIPFIIAVVCIWAASGKIARRLARPLDELAKVVRRLGEGDLKARTELAQYAPGEIGLVAEAVNEMASRIEKQLHDQRELLAAVSHELRTPLARVRIISEIGRDNGATANAKTWDDIDREVVEMDALVGELLASSRVDFGALTMRDLSIRDVALRALERAGLGENVLAVETDKDQVSGDATLLARALSNLFDNAKRHAGGAEKFVVRADGQRLFFEVMDRGAGLKDNLDPFANAGDGSDTRGDGLGLGLKLVKRIALAHQGDVFAVNRQDGGAKVGFWVPLG